MDFGPPFHERLDEKEVIDICIGNGFTLLEKSNIGPYNVFKYSDVIIIF